MRTAIHTIMMAVFVATMALGLSGCLTPQDYTPLAQYTIQPDFNAIPRSKPAKISLGIRRFSAAQPLKRDIFYRDPELRVGNLLDAQWAEFPADMMTRYIFDAATASERFDDVGLATDVSRPTFILTGDVRRFDLNREQDPWRADCEVHFELRTVQNSSAVWSDTLLASVPMTENKIPALPIAMSEAAALVIQHAVGAIVESSVEP